MKAFHWLVWNYFKNIHFNGFFEYQIKKYRQFNQIGESELRGILNLPPPPPPKKKKAAILGGWQRKLNSLQTLSLFIVFNFKKPKENLKICQF